MVIFYALLSAFSYGAADFLGGFSSRKNPALVVVAWSQFVGLGVILIAAPLVGAAKVTVPDLLWGMAAGISGAAGVGLLFKGLSEGLASIVSPMAALTGAVLPVFYGLLSRERPPLLTWIGVGIVLPAILLLSMERGDKTPHVAKSLQLGLISGLAFGGFFIFIAQTGEESGMWPLAAARGTTVPLFFLIALFRKKKILLKRRTVPYALFSGLLDMSANVFYLLATRTGYMILAVILTALYPAPTVFFQRLFLKEKLTPARVAGLILSVTGAALIGAGG